MVGRNNVGVYTMVPSVVATEVTVALLYFLSGGFRPSNPALATVMENFLAEPEKLAKGSYLSIALPFRQAPEGGEPFPGVPLGFTPNRHQRTAGVSPWAIFPRSYDHGLIEGSLRIASGYLLPVRSVRPSSAASFMSSTATRRGT